MGLMKCIKQEEPAWVEEWERNLAPVMIDQVPAPIIKSERTAVPCESRILPAKPEQAMVQYESRIVESRKRKSNSSETETDPAIVKRRQINSRCEARRRNRMNDAVD